MSEKTLKKIINKINGILFPAKINENKKIIADIKKISK